MANTQRDLVKPFYNLPKPPVDDTMGKYMAVLFVGIIVVVGAFLVAGDVANALGGPRIVGAPGMGRLYTPEQLIHWMKSLKVHNPRVYGELLTRIEMYGGAIVLLASLAAGLAMRLFSTTKKINDTHGSARFLLPHEVKKIGLFDNKGIILGVLDNKYMRARKEGHTLVVAPPGLGKTTTVTVPALLEWKGPVFCYEPKGEAWTKTAGYRKKYFGSKCLRLDFMDSSGTGAHYNFLDRVRVGTKFEIGDVENIVTQLSDPDGKGAGNMTPTEQHFINIGSSVLTGSILHVLYAFPPEQRNLGTVASILADPDASSPTAVFEEMKITEHDQNYSMGWADSSGRPTNTHPYIARAATDVISMTDTERSGCISTVKRFLIPFRNPLTAEVTSRSDFKFEDFRDMNLSLFLVVDLENTDTLRPVVRLLINQFVRSMVGALPDGGQVPDEKRILILLEEFDSLKKLSVFEEAINYIRGYGMSALLIIQGFNQLFAAYGKDERISAACANLIVFTPNDIDTMRRISDMVGTTTVRERIPGGGGKGQGPRYSDNGRVLLKPEEVRIMPKDQAIVFIEGQRPILAQKIAYFQDAEFSLRTQVPPPTPTPPNRLSKDQAA